MFPKLKPKFWPPNSDIEKGLRELGKSMTDVEAGPQVGENEPELPLAGYTYFGQFIDHDLTLDLTPLDSAEPRVEQTQNFRTPFLDLDQVYGGGPNLSPHLYRRDIPEGTSPREAERFIIGKTSKGSENDLPRNPDGVALTGDPRQDENLIIAQLHVAFLKLHNVVIANSGMLNDPHNFRRKGESDFAAAQRIVRWHYQWIIRNDYLNAVLDPNVFKWLPELEKKKLANPPSSFAIPVEFSVAAFRFGHSMVRNEYKSINDNQFKVEISALMGLTGSKGLTSPGSQPNTTLPEEWVVCWNRFFQINEPAQLNRARPIDTRIAEGLHHLDEKDVKHFNVAMLAERLEPKLPVRTLVRGFRIGLPSGEQVAAEVARQMPGVRILKEKEIVAGDHDQGSILMDPKYGLRGNTPLWYYILREAEALQGGKHLGPVGSFIVADVIMESLIADRDSYFWASKNAVSGDATDRARAVAWQPTIERLVEVPERAMAELLRFVSRTTKESQCG